MKKTILSLLSVLLLLSAVSCTREYKEDDFIHGSDFGLHLKEDLIMILSETATKSYAPSNSDYKKILDSASNLYDQNTKANVFSLNDLLKIRTASTGEKVKISSIANIFIDPNIPFLNEYQILDYTFQPTKTKKAQKIKELLGTVTNFKGFPNTDYYILPYFFGNYLILYKLAPAHNIPYEELPLAKRVGNLLAVPLVGYPVEYCQPVPILGANNIKKTLKVRPQCRGIQTAESTKYIRLYDYNKQVFKYEEKPNFFHRDFFKGQWFYFKTQLKSSGFDLQEFREPRFFSADLVQFHPSSEKLEIIEVNNLQLNDEERSLSIPVQWKDYEIAKDSEILNPQFKERVKDVNTDLRPYLEMDFNKLLDEIKSVNKKSLKSAVILKDYISFEVEFVNSAGQVDKLVKYAFKRHVEKPSYKEKKWFDKDSFFFFPLYFVQRKYYKPLTDHSENDEDRFRQAVRFDPQQKEIVWHFSTKSPKEEAPWVRELGRLAVELLNQALKTAGKDSLNKIKIVLNENQDKELGDIRYNILNLILSDSRSIQQWTKGVNTANPFTGEVISATANVWLSPILDEYISLLRKYIRFQVYSPIWKMPALSSSMVDSIKDFAQKEDKNIQNVQCVFNKKALGVTPFFHEKITKVCPEVTSFIAKNKGKTFSLKQEKLDDDKQVLFCAQKMAQEKILQMILKNMLHSLGLKNMKSSSADIENFYIPSEIETLLGTKPDTVPLHYFSLWEKTQSHPAPPQYSSVMEEIMDKQYPILSVPGKLDISALRFLYFDKVEFKDGTVLEVPSGQEQKSILETAQPIFSLANTKDFNEQLNKHKMCLTTREPIVCEDTGYGSHLIELTANNICEIHNTLLINRHRYHSKDFYQLIDTPLGKFIKTRDYFKDIEPNTLPLYRLNGIYLKWEEYRNNLLKKSGKSIEDYNFFNPHHLNEYTQLIEQAKEESPNIKAYDTARHLLFDYLTRLSFVPAKHCIYKENDSYKAIALEGIEDEIRLNYPEESREEFRDCRSPIVQKWANESLAEGSKLQTEVGFFGKEKRYLIQADEQNDPVDESQAFNFIRDILDRFNNSNTKISREPDLMFKYYQEWIAYATQGLDLKPYITDENIEIGRILSYKIDSMDMGLRGNSKYFIKHLWDFRLWPFTDYKKHQENPSLSMIQNHLFSQTFTQYELKELTSTIETHPDLYTDFPFLTTLYDKFQQLPLDDFFAFIQEHPAVLVYNNLYYLPYEDNESYIVPQLNRKYNQGIQCIANDSQTNPCDQLEEKLAFINLLKDSTREIFYTGPY